MTDGGDTGQTFKIQILNKRNIEKSLIDYIKQRD